MRTLKWSTSHAVFVSGIDDEHKEIFEGVSRVRRAFIAGAPQQEVRELTECLVTCIEEHFAHEERLMRAARYPSLAWHREKHTWARKRVREFVGRMEQGDANAALAMVEYLTSWLPDHAMLPDRMMGAYLRNHQRCMWKVTFRAGTRPLAAGSWVDVNGKPLDLR
ncbi:MAG TPA: hemerythrin family protein [Bryobacteraceae bacterium]|jgi:hemerythrin